MKKTKKLLLISFVTSLISACAGNAPKPPVIPYCPVVAAEGGIPYLYCQNSDGSGEKWRVRIDQEFWKRKEKTICTTDTGYGAAYKYGQELKRWTDQHCK